MTQETPFGAASVRSELLTRREAAAYLGVSEQTLAIWKCTGRYNLPYIKIGIVQTPRFGCLHLKKLQHRVSVTSERPKNSNYPSGDRTLKTGQ